MTDQVDETVEEQIDSEETTVNIDDSDENTIEINDNDFSDIEDDESPEDSGELDESEEFHEIDINGKVYRVPAELKSGVMMQKDYTQKTQEVAEQRKALEAEQERIRSIETSQRQNLKSYAEITAIDAQLEEYKEVDWNAAFNENPTLAQQHQFRYGQLKEEKQAKENELKTQESQALNLQQQRAAQQLEQSQRRLASEIKGWSGDTAKNVASQANEMGFSKDFLHALNTGVFPDAVPMIKALHKAAEYDKMLNSAKKVQKAPVVEIKPTKRVKGGNTPVRKSIYSKDLTPAERINLYKKAAKK